LFLVEQVGGPSRIRILDYGSGNGDFEVPILPVSAVGGLLRVSSTTDDVVYENQSFTTPAAWFIADGSARVQGTALVQRSPVDMSDVVVTRHEAVSKDGTKVPYTTFQIKDGAKGAPKNGEANVWLTGYGGFEVAIAPTFRAGARAWLEQGGVVAVGNMRGGSEFGEAWHQAGAKTNKQHVFDDFIAIGEDLIARKVTTSQHLIIQGGSNGGLLMGAALTERPDLWKAVVAQVGYFDMLRYETKPNGAFNNTEYGSVANEAEYKALAGYSPYHHVKDGVKYPPTLFMTGANDPRVDPLHSRKMVARLQAVGANALLRTSGGTGHGGGTPLSARIAEAVDVHAFLFHELGVTYRAP
jgi:prolyl oligopeptidase